VDDALKRIGKEGIMVHPDLPREAHRKITKLKTADVQTVMSYGYTKYGVTPCSLVYTAEFRGNLAPPESSSLLKNVALTYKTPRHHVPQDNGPKIHLVKLLKPQHKVKLLLGLMVPDMGKRVSLFADFLALPACPSDNSSINIKMSIEHYLTCNLKPQIHQDNE
jgi:hypothetical protein